MNDEQTARMPLAGVRVVDMSNYLAGPLCTMYLADYGADVVKIENPRGGDPMRLWGHNKNGVGLYYKMINRNKKSVTLDLRTPFGVEAVKKLVAGADVVVENYRTGVLEKWGLDYENLKEVNPGVIMLSITGFGRTGPYRNRPGFGSLAEAFAGFSHINGYPDGPPLSPSWGLGDCSTGIGAAFLVMTALFERERRGGEGQQIDSGDLRAVAHHAGSPGDLLRPARFHPGQERLAPRVRRAEEQLRDQRRPVGAHRGLEPVHIREHLQGPGARGSDSRPQVRRQPRAHEERRRHRRRTPEDFNHLDPR